MSYGTYKHRRSKVGKAHFKKRAFVIRVGVIREPVHVTGAIYGTKVKKLPAFVATACVAYARKSARCASAQGHGPTAAVRKALAKLARTMK